MTTDPIHRGQLHVGPDTDIACRPVDGHSVSIITFGRFFDLFATRNDLARIAAVITAYLNLARELTVEPDPAEAERFRLECERDQKGEDE